jgi:FkbM family methyltransferase
MVQEQEIQSPPWMNPTPAQKLKRRIRQLTGRSTYINVGPSIMEVPQDQTLAFFSNGDYYERNTSYWIEKLLAGTTQKVFYDIGANYGYYCLKLAPLATHIYAFEPVLRTHAMLAKNLGRNGLINVTAYQLGITDRQGSAIIHLHRKRFFANSASSSLFRSSIRSAGQETITVVSLDNLVRERHLLPPSVIKIDIEGGELYALRGAQEVLSTYHPIMVMEFNGLEIFQDVGYARGDMLTLLLDLHYVVYGLSSNVADFTAYPLDRFSEIPMENIIALPPEMEHLVREV